MIIEDLPLIIITDLASMFCYETVLVRAHGVVVLFYVFFCFLLLLLYCVCVLKKPRERGQGVPTLIGTPCMGVLDKGVGLMLILFIIFIYQ